MERVAKKITSWLVENNAIDDADKELYEYAIYSILITISPLFLVLIIGIAIRTLLEGVVLILPFMCIRKFSGGYHTKNAGICFISSCGILIMCMYLATHLGYAWWITVITAICVFSLCMNSPIDSENKRLDDSEKRHYQKIVIGVSIIFYVIHFICVYIKLEKLAICLAIGIGLTASLQLPCLFQLNSRSGQGAAE